jgi:hypothetical protein
MSKSQYAKIALLTRKRAILHDESTYVNPNKFDPDRFVSPQGGLNDDLVTANFGFGRRWVTAILSQTRIDTELGFGNVGYVPANT